MHWDCRRPLTSCSSESLSRPPVGRAGNSLGVAIHSLHPTSQVGGLIHAPQLQPHPRWIILAHSEYGDLILVLCMDHTGRRNADRVARVRLLAKEVGTHPRLGSPPLETPDTEREVLYPRVPTRRRVDYCVVKQMLIFVQHFYSSSYAPPFKTALRAQSRSLSFMHHSLCLPQSLDVAGFKNAMDDDD